MSTKVQRGLFTILAVLLSATVLFFVFAPVYVDRAMNGGPSADSAKVSVEAQNLHQQLFVADLHADTLLWQRNLLSRNRRGHLDVPRMREGNIALQIFTAVTKSPAGQNYDQNSSAAADNITLLAVAQLWPVASWASLSERALYQARRLWNYAQQAPDQLMVVTSRADLDVLLARRAAGEAVVGGLLGTEGSHALDGKLENVERLFDGGYRVMGLQHFFDNALGGSLHGDGKGGLTDFGRQAVAAMLARDVIIDVAHSSPQVVRDVLAMTDRPLILSHTGIQSHCRSARNVPDELMKAIAMRGGLIGIGFWEGAICDDSPAGVAAAIIAAVNLLGEDHVALGSDFDGTVATGFDAANMAVLTQALMDAGLSESVIRAVMGANQLRFLQENLPRS